MAQYAGLEFDARRSGVVSDDGLHEVSPLSKGFDEKKSPYMDSTNALPQDRPQEKRICGFRRATFWLSITTALALALAIVAAAVGGYLAVKRGTAWTSFSRRRRMCLVNDVCERGSYQVLMGISEN